MASREVEVVTYLRQDEPLGELAPGGIYADSDLPTAGLTDQENGDVWAGGVFQDTLVVRERAPVPTGDLQSIASQHTSMSQAIEVWGYSTDPAALQAMMDRVYTLMMGKRLAKAFSATWVGGMPRTQAPELPSGTFTRHEDYRVVSIRTPVEV